MCLLLRAQKEVTEAGQRRPVLYLRKRPESSREKRTRKRLCSISKPEEDRRNADRSLKTPFEPPFHLVYKVDYLKR